MPNIIDLVKNSMEKKCDIYLKFDEEKEIFELKVDGDMPNILTAISYIVNKLIENGMPKELILGAVEIGIREEKNKKQFNIVSGISSKEKAEIIEKVLEKLLKGE